MLERQPATFVATTRVSITDVASIALYIHAQGEFAETRSGVLNMGVKMLANITKQKYPVLKVSDAVEVLHRLGYGDSRKKGTKYFTAISVALKEEMAVEEERKKRQSITDIAVAEFRQAEREQASLDTRIENTMIQAENMIDSPLAPETVPEASSEVTTKADSDTVLDLSTVKPNTKTARTSQIDIADIDQKSSNEAKQMRAQLGQMPAIEVEGDEKDD